MKTLTRLVGETFHWPPGRSDVITSCFRQAASLSLTCLMSSLDWKTLEINDSPDYSQSHYSISHTRKHQICQEMF